MIYEMRIYTVPPRGVPEYYEKFGEIFEKRQALSRLVGIFNAEFGDLNRVMHIWEYKNAAHREETREKALGYDWWPPPTGHLLRKQVTKLMTTPAFLPEPRLGEFGGVYEVRTYTLFPGKQGEMAKLWEPNIAAREELSPLAAAFMTESGMLNEWIHIWAYKDPVHRNEIRTKTRDMPNWPSPGSLALIESQKSELWIPGPYSLMR